MLRGIVKDHCGVRSVALANMLQKREHHREDNALLHTEEDNRSCSYQGEGIFSWSFAANFREAPMVYKFDTDQEHNGGQDCIRKKAQWPGQKQQHQEHDGCRGQMRPLASPARGVHHGGLGGADIDQKRAAATSRDIGKRQAH